MPSLEDLDRRLTAVEREVAMQSRLRAAQDRDLAALTIKQDKMLDGLRALSETVSEHNQKIDRLTVKVDEHTRILGEHTRILGEHTRILGEHGVVLARLEIGMTTITGMLTHLIERDSPPSRD